MNDYDHAANQLAEMRFYTIRRVDGCQFNEATSEL